jgi:sugar phosphate isomerase/epimerase
VTALAGDPSWSRIAPAAHRSSPSRRPTWAAAVFVCPGGSRGYNPDRHKGAFNPREEPPVAKKMQVALQMYTVRNEVEADCPATLKAVAEMGYPAVQAGPTKEFGAKDVRRMMDALGLVSAGVHVGIDMLEKQFDAAVEMVKTFGVDLAIVSWMPEDRRKTADDWRRAGATMTEFGARLKAVGLRLSYHNHSFEFNTFGGQYGYDLFYAAVDPDLVLHEIDTYWVRHGNEDPVAYLDRWPGRMPTVHFKDMGRGPDRPMVPVGTGILDWPKIVAACKKGGTEFVVVEQDTCAPLSPLEAARISLENCRKWGLV